jgi:Glutamate-cysteine ligase
MATAQKRDAAISEKFYFRKNVFPPGQTSPCSSTGSSGTNSPCSGIRIKEKQLRNCFPELQLPENELSFAPVEEEYEKMSVNEIICGKVRMKCSRVSPIDFCSRRVKNSRAYWAWYMRTWRSSSLTSPREKKLRNTST